MLVCSDLDATVCFRRSILKSPMMNAGILSGASLSFLPSCSIKQLMFECSAAPSVYVTWVWWQSG